MENTEDRPWYDRDFVRVDWSKNQVSNFVFYVDMLSQDPVAYFVEDEDEDRVMVSSLDEDGEATSQNYFVSCAQACMIRARGVAKAKCLTAVNLPKTKPVRLERQPAAIGHDRPRSARVGYLSMRARPVAYPRDRR